LAVVVGFVLGDVEPFTVVVPAKFFVDGREPLVVSLAEFSEILLAGFMKDI